MKFSIAFLVGALAVATSVCYAAPAAPLVGPVGDSDVMLWPATTITERIKQLKNLIRAKSGELTEIILEQATATSAKAKEVLAEKRAQLVKEITRLRDQLLQLIREWMIPDDDVEEEESKVASLKSSYVIEEAIEQIIRHLKEQIKEAIAVIANLGNAFTRAGREKIRQAKAKLLELMDQLRNAIAKWGPQADNETTYHPQAIVIHMKTLVEASSALNEIANDIKTIIQNESSEDKKMAYGELLDIVQAALQ